MKILVFNGSPKKEKSDTLHITSAFLEGIGEKCDAQVEVIHVIDKHIEYCSGCFSCMKNGGVCIHKDDMSGLLHKILESDVLIFSFPLYCYGMPAPLKNLLDRTMPLSSMAMHEVNGRYEHEGQADYSHLKYVMICGCGFPNSTHNFEPMVMEFKQMFPNNHTIITIPESPMFNVPEASSVTLPRLELVKIAGREYADDFTVSDELLAQLRSPMIPEDTYARIANGEQQI